MIQHVGKILKNKNLTNIICPPPSPLAGTGKLQPPNTEGRNSKRKQTTGEAFLKVFKRQSNLKGGSLKQILLSKDAKIIC
jgi:hypothetical protein